MSATLPVQAFIIHEHGDSIHDAHLQRRTHFCGAGLGTRRFLGGSKEKALRNLKEAMRLFLEEAEKIGTLEQILEEAGYSKGKQKLAGPKLISVQRVTLPLPLTRAKA